MCTRVATFGNGNGGAQRAVQLQIKILNKLGYKIILFAPKALLEGKVPDGIEYVDIPWPAIDVNQSNFSRSKFPPAGIATLLWAYRVSTVLKKYENKVNCFHLHEQSVGALYFNSSIRNKSVSHQHGLEEFSYEGLIKEINRSFLKKLSLASNLARYTITTDKSITPKIVEKLKVNPEKIFYLPNVIDEKSIANKIDDENAE